MSAGPAAALLAAAGAAALLAQRTASVAVIAVVLLAVCLRAPRERRRPYLFGALSSALGVFVFWPLFQADGGGTTLWSGPTIPVLGTLDVTTGELRGAAFQALRLAALGLAFAAYALRLDHDRLAQGAGFARRSSLMVALAIRLVPTLERDAVGLTEALRGRGVVVDGIRGHARLVRPLLAGSLERGLNLAEAMEARGYGRAGRSRAPRPPWTRLDRAALGAGALLVAAGAVWL